LKSGVSKSRKGEERRAGGESLFRLRKETKMKRGSNWRGTGDAWISVGGKEKARESCELRLGEAETTLDL